MAFATVADLEQRWRALSADEYIRAEALLDDASIMLAQAVQVDETDETQSAALRAVACSMVRRSMASGDSGFFGASQGTVSADIYSQTVTFANPSGDLYITSAEKRMLGISGGFIGSIPAQVAQSGW